ncbi:MAG: M20 family metallo-hydrolase [Thermoplasmata archaeon]|nr:M20 family metallo-hydrolase [Thermoplasmata archaeon]
MRKGVFNRLDSKEKEMAQSLIEMCRIPAYHPSSGGDGEAEKAKHIEGLAKALGLKSRLFRATDKRVSAGYRPNLVVYPDKFPGNDTKNVWLVAHTDVVPPGELAKWKTPPFEPRIKAGKIFGRGVEDNGQAIVSSLYALWALKEEGIETNAAIALVADEETGSEKGIQHLISKKLFKKEDLIVISDWGTTAGNCIEIAEKSILWCRLTTEGKQVHASLPHLGLNAFRAASRLLCTIDERLHERFGMTNEIFDPPFSSFEPTKKEPNVQNINTIPGTDVFHFDCRVLPDYDLDDVIALIKKVAKNAERKNDVKIKVEFVQKERSPPTPENCEVVQKVKDALKEVRGIDAKIVGIGGGTCAAFFRKKGYEVAVWQTNDFTAHQANENMKIKNMVADAKVFTHVFSK